MSKPPSQLQGAVSALSSLGREKPRASPTIDTIGLNLLTARTIGGELDLFRRELLEIGRELRGLQGLRSDLFVDETLLVLGRLTCKIAVVGQVKAGKSSFINAFVRRPGLLPTDVNPWTTAITKLHFGHADAPPNVAAVFSFFGADEWRRIAEGGGQLRDLTMRLVPGFETELLQSHVDAMRRRSEGRLGTSLAELLGQRHSYAELSSQILERYVCAGATAYASADTSEKGYYSDVVKTADLYFDASDFAFPTTILDTPGTNDPFLVRDEITRGALESADVYIIVLTARQALSSSDVALLRILRGLHKHRIVVFINRIDELGDVVRDTPQIIQHVRTGLAREFPDTEIQIVAGSAYWAGLAIAGGEAEIKRALTPKATAYIAQMMARNGTNAILTPLLDNGTRDQLSQALLLSSGLPAISTLLEGQTLRSHAGQVLKQVKTSFAELIHVYANAARHELDGLAFEVRVAVKSQQQAEEEFRLIKSEVEENNRLMASLHSLVIDLQARTDQLIDDRCDSMRGELSDLLQRYTALESRKFRQAADAGRQDRVWRCGTAGLRRALEASFVPLHRSAEHEINCLESSIFPRLRDLLREAHPLWTDQDDKGGREAPQPAPSLNALGAAVALDLAEPWWKRWFIVRQSTDERVGQLERLIASEFGPIIDALIAASRKQLKAQQSSTLGKATRIYLGLVEIFQEQSTAQLKRMRVLISSNDTVRQHELRESNDVREAELKHQLAIAERMRVRLSGIEQRWGEKVQ